MKHKSGHRARNAIVSDKVRLVCQAYNSVFVNPSAQVHTHKLTPHTGAIVNQPHNKTRLARPSAF